MFSRKVFFPNASAQTPLLGLLGIMLVTSAAYWIGLRGPFVLDDNINLAAIQEWLAGRKPLADLLFDSTSSPFGRPLAVGSLALSAWIGGFSPFAFKLGNLALHLACGAVIYALVLRLTRRDANLQVSARLIATLVAALWLLHPLNASTVLYAVQRMAQLSALFVLLGMWLYMAMRERLGQGASLTAIVGLLAGIPLLTIAGFLSKENALVLPAICLVLELGCFGPTRPRAVKAFFGIVLLLPSIIGLAWFAMKPAWLMGGYVQRDFDWQERLLTQARALCDYLWKMIAPNPPQMGVYTDDFALSTGLLSPPTTLAAIVALLAISIAALRLRRLIPALFLGWGIFLAGHAIESSFLPLELYFEHRNYLPTVGVLYAVIGLVFAVGARLRTAGLQPRRIGNVLMIASLTMLALGTHGRARVWSDEQLLAESAVAAHPDSMRAQLAVVDNAVRRRDFARAQQALDELTRSPHSRIRAQGHLNRINLDCATRRTANATDLAGAVRNAPTRISKDEAETFDLLFRNTNTPCAGVSNQALGSAASHFANLAAEQSDRLGAKAELRHTAARFYARTSDWANALAQAKLAWQPGMPAAASVILVQAQLATGDIDGAERTYHEAFARMDPGKVEDVAGLAWLRKRIDQARQPNQIPAASAP